MYRRNIQATASTAAPPVVTATQRLQQHLANDPKKTAIKVGFDRCGSHGASSMLRQITVRDTEFVLRLEQVLVSSLSKILLIESCEHLVVIGRHCENACHIVNISQSCATLQVSQDSTNRLILFYGPTKFVSLHFEVKMDSLKARHEYIAKVNSTSSCRACCHLPSHIFSEHRFP